MRTFLQARANKSKDKPDADLDEFEKVKRHQFHGTNNLFTCVPRFSKNTDCKDRKTKHSRSVLKARKPLQRNGQLGKVSSDDPTPNPSFAKVLFVGIRSKKAAPAPMEDDMYDD